MKKFLIPVLLFCSVIVLAGCGTKESANEPENTQAVVEDVQQDANSDTIVEETTQDVNE